MKTKMGKGLWYAVISNLMGTTLAIALGWFMPTWIQLSSPVRPVQYVLTSIAFLCGAWMTYQILIGKDETANKTAAFFSKTK